MIDDAEIRGRLLKYFYQLRDANGGWCPTSEIILSPHPVSRAAIANACQHLAEAGYIQWEPFNPPLEQQALGRAKIKGTGIDVVTGAREPTIDIRFPGVEDAGVVSVATAPGAISAEGRRARFEQWEKLGLAQVKADLANGGHRVIGGSPAVRQLAWEWVGIKEAEKEHPMARNSSSNLQRSPATLSPDQMRSGITRIKNRIAELDAFDVSSIVKPDDPRISALEISIDETLESVFGADSTKWKRYRPAAYLHKDIGAGLLHAVRGGSPPISELQDEFVEVRDRSRALLHQAIKSLEEEVAESEPTIIGDIPAPSRKVFIVHGHDAAPKAEVARFIEKLGFEAIILHERPNKGRTLITKFREEADGAGFAVVLMTPDDLGKAEAVTDLKPRARQNVVFELGFFIGKLGPERVAALMKGNIEKPSDFDGVVYISLDSDWQKQLGQELKAAGYSIDWNKVMES